MIKRLLQGKPLGHPLHPAIVHFPIGLWFISLAFDAGNFLADGENWLVRAAFYTMAAATGAAVLVAVPGFADWSDIRRDHPARRIANYHMLLNLVAVAIYAANLWVRSGQLDRPAAPVIGVALSLAGLGLISISGYLGGMLVYDDGVGVGRHRRTTPLPDDTLHAYEATEPHGYVPVALDGLGEGETLRADVAGYTITIARFHGKLYAFQEFCTHRYGPLSEGTLQNGQVTCPWHRSCFDLRTGKAVSGPAKEDLKTFEVKSEKGQILVAVPQRSA